MGRLLAKSPQCQTQSSRSLLTGDATPLRAFPRWVRASCLQREPPLRHHCAVIASGRHRAMSTIAAAGAGRDQAAVEEILTMLVDSPACPRQAFEQTQATRPALAE